MHFHPPLTLPAPDAPAGATAHHLALADLLRAAVALESDPARWSGPLASPAAAPVGGLSALEAEAGVLRHGAGRGWLTVPAVTLARDLASLDHRRALPALSDRWALLDGLAVAAEAVTHV